MANKQPNKINDKHFWYAVTPLLLVVAIVIGINLLSQSPANNQDMQSEVMDSTAVSTQSSISATAPTRPPILQATILPTPPPTATPLPQVPADAAIKLLGPPNESNLPEDGRISFYWHYSEALLPGQELVLTLHQRGLILDRSLLTQPNVGTGYLDLPDLTNAATEVPITWQVTLHWQGSTQVLLSSQQRSLTLLPER